MYPYQQGQNPTAPPLQHPNVLQQGQYQPAQQTMFPAQPQMVPQVQYPPAQPQMIPQVQYPPAQQQPQYSVTIQVPASSAAPAPIMQSCIPQFQQPMMPHFHNQFPNMPIPQTKPEAPKVGWLIKNNPSLRPFAKFDVNADAQALRKAMKGIGTDEKALINILCARSLDQRMQIKDAFNKIFSRNLVDDIISETSGNFEKVLVSLLKTTDEVICADIHESLSNTFTSADVVIDAVCLKTDEELRLIDETYKRLYSKSLVPSIKEGLSGDLKNLLTAVAECKIKTRPTSESSPKVDAQILKNAVKGLFNDQNKFVQIFSTRCFDDLKHIAKEYEAMFQKTLHADIEKNFSGDFKEALLAMLNADNQEVYFARRLHKSMKGLGTNDTALIRNVVTRCELDMEEIKKFFQAQFNESLKSYIEGDTSGYYKKALLTLCGYN